MHQADTLAGELALAGGRISCKSESIFNRPNAGHRSHYVGYAKSSLRPDIEYRGHRIVWDARQVEGTSLWTGRAAVVSPANISGIKSVYKIRIDSYFPSEEEVRDYLVSAAKDRIDSGPEL